MSSTFLRFKLITLMILCVAIGYNAQAQSVGKLSFKNDGFTGKKFNHAPKKIYLQYFSVNYQTVMISYAQARGGVTYGSASSTLALGLDGLNEATLQAMTDKYYQAFKSKIEAAGYSIMTPEELQQNEHFAKLEQVEGGTPTMDVLARGYLTTSPTGFTTFVGNGNIFNLNGETESKKLGGIIVARVSITVPFAESQEINGGLVGGVAKIKAKCDLRLSPSESVPTKSDFKKPQMVYTNISFVFKESLKWQALYQGKLQKPTDIAGVLDEKKVYKATSVGESGFRHTNKAWIPGSYSANAIPVSVDEAKYKTGVDQAVNEYLNASLEGFLKDID